MHCGDFDHRNVSILPPFNTLHAQVIKKGPTPQILDQTQAQVVYSGVSNPQDPALANPVPSRVYKTNFWDLNPRTGHTLAFDAYNAHYPPGVLSLFPLSADLGLPVPDLQRLYLGDHQLTADQQAMPSLTAPPAFTQPYVANTPQAFKLFYTSFPFFLNFPFGYTQPGVNWFSAEGIPVAPFDDQGRSNPFPLMRVQALAAAGVKAVLVGRSHRAGEVVVAPTPVSLKQSLSPASQACTDVGGVVPLFRKAFRWPTKPGISNVDCSSSGTLIE